MDFLNKQLDTMMTNPTPDEHFLGNTYKWWASFLDTEEVAAPLNQQSLPICLVHGVDDRQIPVLSADRASENLAKTNALTYLRLEGYGHDLDTADVQDAACRWLNAVLLGQELSDGILMTQANFSISTSLKDTQADMSDYVFRRGKDKDKGEDRGGGGKMHAEVEANRDSKGNERMSADVGASRDLGTDFGGCQDTADGNVTRKNLRTRQTMQHIYGHSFAQSRHTDSRVGTQ